MLRKIRGIDHFGKCRGYVTRSEGGFLVFQRIIFLYDVISIMWTAIVSIAHESQLRNLSSLKKGNNTD